MGKLSRATRQRHELRQRQRREIQETQGHWDSPEVQAELTDLWDADCERFRDTAAPEQIARLHGRGWRRAKQNADGIGHWVHKGRRLGLIHSIAREVDGEVWAHVSVSTAASSMPTWNEVRDAGWLLYPGHYGIIVVAPTDGHVNISNTAHVWYCLTAQACPDFTHGHESI